MGLPELPRLHPVGAPEIDALAILVELQQSRVGAIDHPHRAVRAQEHIVRLSQVWPDVERLAGLIEDLHAAIRSIRDEDAAVLVDRDAMHAAQLPRPIAARAE